MLRHSSVNVDTQIELDFSALIRINEKTAEAVKIIASFNKMNFNDII